MPGSFNMKTTIVLVILIITAFLLIGANASAQKIPSDRDWVDSLSITYRHDYLEGEVLKDSAVLKTLKTTMHQLKDKAKRAEQEEHTADEQAIDAKHAYKKERHAQRIRGSAYKKEMKREIRDRTRASTIKLDCRLLGFKSYDEMQTSLMKIISSTGMRISRS